MSVEYYDFDVNIICHGRLRLAATGYENACEIADGLMDRMLDGEECEFVGELRRIGVEAFDSDGIEIYRKGEI